MEISFYKWLQTQRGTDTPVADLAFDVAFDPSFPRKGSYRAYRKYMTAKFASDEAMQAFEDAWRQWSRDGFYVTNFS